MEEKTRYYVLVMIISVVLVLSVIQSIQINKLKSSTNAAGNQVTGAVVGQVDMTGWTDNEKMLYEHHGTLAARAQGAKAKANPGTGMVGGC